MLIDVYDVLLMKVMHSFFFVCPAYSPVHLPQASAPTTQPHPTSPAQPPPVPEVRLSLWRAAYFTVLCTVKLLGDIFI